MTDDPLPVADPLTAVVLDIERHEAARGWDLPARMYALAASAELLQHEPELANSLGIGQAATGPLTAIEQGDLPWHGSLGESLARIGWPETVAGAAVVTELLQEAADPDGNPAEPQEMRVVVAVLRDGSRMCALRFRAHDDERSVLTGEALAPDLVDAVAATLD